MSIRFTLEFFGESQINHILMTVFLELSPFEKTRESKSVLNVRQRLCEIRKGMVVGERE